ncbi:MAG: SDR family NAD(P)-dependent oxidoreductase [Mycobacteriales bacterium]
MLFRPGGPEAARAAVAGIAGVEVDTLDLADLGSVQTFTDGFLASGRNVDLVINNAGIMACPETRVGPAWEAQFATNHLGHYALVNRLWPAIAQGGGRVVTVSSVGHHRSSIRWNDVQFEYHYDRFLAYGQAKTANVLFAAQLDALAQRDGVRAFAIHPGKIITPLQRHLSLADQMAAGWLDETGNLIDPTFKTPEQGAATEVWAATSPQLNGVGGVYCEDCATLPSSRSTRGRFRGSENTRSTRTRRCDCGNCRPSLPASMPSPRTIRRRPAGILADGRDSGAACTSIPAALPAASSTATLPFSYRGRPPRA